MGEPALSSEPDEMLMCQGVLVPAQALATPRPATELPAEVLSVLDDPLLGIEEPLSEWLIADESAESVTIMHELDELGTCPSNPPTPFTVDLEQPLADRTILNAAVVPARTVTLP